MVPQLPIAMLACARIGAPHVVVFGGFSPDSLGERMSSTGCKVLVTQDEGWRKGAAIPLKEIAEKAIQQGRDLWWHELVDGKPTECEPERCKAEDVLYLLHTSGTTAKPKAAVHISGG